jgi:hypothetical protein
MRRCSNPVSCLRVADSPRQRTQPGGSLLLRPLYTQNPPDPIRRKTLPPAFLLRFYLPILLVTLFGSLAQQMVSWFCTRSEISSYAMAIFRVGAAIVLFQIFFFAQDLTVEQPCGHAEINQ